MSVITGKSRFVQELLGMLGVPKNAISVEIRMEVGEPVIVACEFYPDEIEFGKDGEPETIKKEYLLMEREDDGD